MQQFSERELKKTTIHELEMKMNGNSRNKSYQFKEHINDFK